MVDVFVDVEADGPCPGLYSMVSFGAAVMKGDEIKTFYSGVIRPLNGAKWIPEALNVSGITREQHLEGIQPLQAMINFSNWLGEHFPGQSRFTFWSDNPAFDWQFINFYWHGFLSQKNVFGFSARRIGDLYCGLKKDLRANSEWKRFRKTKHDHNPANDAKGNLEAFNEIKKIYRI